MEELLPVQLKSPGGMDKVGRQFSHRPFREEDETPTFLPDPYRSPQTSTLWAQATPRGGLWQVSCLWSLGSQHVACRASSGLEPPPGEPVSGWETSAFQQCAELFGARPQLGVPVPCTAEGSR